MLEDDLIARDDEIGSPLHPTRFVYSPRQDRYLVFYQLFHVVESVNPQQPVNPFAAGPSGKHEKKKKAEKMRQAAVSSLNLANTMSVVRYKYCLTPEASVKDRTLADGTVRNQKWKQTQNTDATNRTRRGVYWC